VNRPAVLLLAVPLAAAACGGSSKSAHTTTAQAHETQAEFVQAGNQVCIRSDRRVYRIGRLTRDPQGWAKTAAAGRVGLREMRSVTPSAESAAAYQLMLSYAQQLVAAIQRVHDNLVKKNYNTAISAQFAAARLQDKVHAQAKAAGLTFCQQSLTNWPL
jgi:hypothetical protein